jgi:hypothetical protein
VRTVVLRPVPIAGQPGGAFGEEKQGLDEGGGWRV